LLGIKVLISYIKSNSKEKNKDFYAKNNKMIFEKLFSFLENLDNMYNGETIEENEDNKEGKLTDIEKSKLKLEIIKGILKLSNITEIKSNNFLLLNYSIIDKQTTKEFKKEIFQKLYDSLMNRKIALKFTSILFFSLMEQDNALITNLYLKNIINNQRRYNEYLQHDLSKKDSSLHCPEYILPTLIHILTNYIDFEKEKEKFINFQRILISYYDLVLLSESENLQFFYQLISKIKERKDVELNQDSENLQIVCDLNISILNKISELKPFPNQFFPGQIYIPNYFRKINENESFKPDNKKIYLSNEIKIDEKKSRKLNQKVEEKKSPLKNSPSKNVKTTPIKKNNSTPKTNSTRKKIQNEIISPRNVLSRNAKKSLKYTEAEDEEKESIKKRKNKNDDEYEDEEPSVKKKKKIE
jgi:hypothetical protein